MERVRVAVTGMGIVSPVGNTVQDAWDSIRNGRSGIDRITLFDPTDSPVQIAGEVKQFDISAYGVPHRTSRKLARFSRFLLAAGIQAVEDAGFPGGVLPAERTGVIAGNCLGGEDAIDAAYRRFLAPADGARLIPALTTPLTISNEAAANLAMYFGLHGPALTVST
ncbi:MAG: beta-ketoacyl-[Treponema sp.]|nr:beta-ketoacyl-[acyl-carrier-protein] synthase II [Treponema sp.]